MELGTAGAVLSFALELERQAASFYQEALAHPKVSEGTRVRGVLEQLAQQQRRRVKRLERLRREQVTEMILEPIRGLEDEPYRIQVEVQPRAEASQVVAQAIRMEENIKSFLEAAAAKLHFLPELSGDLQRLANQIEDSLESLRPFT